MTQPTETGDWGGRDMLAVGRQVLAAQPFSSLLGAELLAFSAAGVEIRIALRPELMQQHVQELQTIDLIAQKQRSLAALLRADCPRSALSDICLDDLKSRLHELVESHRSPAASARLN